MDTIFTLPLFVLACLQALVALLLLAPKPVSLPIASAIRSLGKSAASKAVLLTIQVALVLLTATSFAELVRGADKVKKGDLRADVISAVDYLRAQVSCVLSGANVLLMLLSVALSGDKCALNSTEKNFEAFKRQAQGLQKEYERVTKSQVEVGGGDASAEIAALKKQVTQLIAKQGDYQVKVDEAEKAKKTAEANAEALLSQVKGMDKAFDQLLDERKALERRLAEAQAAAAGGHQQATGGGFFSAASKKDD